MNQSVRFEEVVDRIKEKVDKDNTALVYYVGGEHIETDEVKIQSRGLIKGSTIGPAFHMKFSPGDILLMSRNPHLRKAAMVDFEGICSDVSYVCRTKDPEVLDQRYLAFVLRTDDFWRFAEENKKGSTNFFLNWSDFADYEFDLPPIEKQRELAELLWAANDLKESYKKLIVATDEMLKAKFREMFGGMKWFTVGLLDLGSCKNGLNFSPKETKFTIQCVGVSDFRDRTRLDDYSNVARISVDEEPSLDMLLQDGDFVFVRSNGNKDLVGRCMRVYPGGTKVSFGGFCIRFRCESDKVDAEFLLHYLCSTDARKKMAGRGGCINNLSQKILAQIQIPLPPLALQREFVEIARKADEMKAALKKSIADINNVIKGLING